MDIARSQEEADEMRLNQIIGLAKSYGINITEEDKVIQILSDTVLAKSNIAFYQRWLSQQNKVHTA